MSIISTAQAVPSRLFTIYSALFDSSSGEPKERVKSWATPPSLRTRGGTDEDGEAATSLFTNTLVEARKLGLVEEVGDKLRIPDAARGAVKKVTDSKIQFREHLIRILFDTEKADEAQQSAFMLALSWFLTLDPLSPLGFAQPPQIQMAKDLGDEYKRRRLQASTAIRISFIGHASLASLQLSVAVRRTIAKIRAGHFRILLLRSSLRCPSFFRKTKKSP